MDSVDSYAVRSAARNAARSSSRRRTSAARDTRVRATSLVSRSVRSPTQWARPASGRRPEPPLKSMNSILMRPGGWAAANAAARVRRNSDLPDPVVPATRKWGPSVWRSSRRGPERPTPTTTGRPRRCWRTQSSAGKCPALRTGQARRANRPRGCPPGEPGDGALALKRRQLRSKTSAGTRSGVNSSEERADESLPCCALRMMACTCIRIAGAVDHLPAAADCRGAQRGGFSGFDDDQHPALVVPARSGRQGFQSGGLMRGESCGCQEARGKERRGWAMNVDPGPPGSGVAGKLQHEGSEQPCHSSFRTTQGRHGGPGIQGHGHHPEQRRPKPGIRRFQPDIRALAVPVRAAARRVPCVAETSVTGSGSADEPRRDSSPADGAARRRRSVSSRAAAATAALNSRRCLLPDTTGTRTETADTAVKARKIHIPVTTARPAPIASGRAAASNRAALLLFAAGLLTTSGSETSDPAEPGLRGPGCRRKPGTSTNRRTGSWRLSRGAPPALFSRRR